MSLYRWFKASDEGDDEAALTSAKRFVDASQKESLELARRGRKRKATERHHYDKESKTAIGKHALRYGNRSAVEMFSKSLGFEVPEATVRNFKRELEKQVKEGKRFEDTHINSKKRGRHLLLP